MDTYIYIHTYTYTYTYIHIYIYVFICEFLRISANIPRMLERQDVDCKMFEYHLGILGSFIPVFSYHFPKKSTRREPRTGKKNRSPGRRSHILLWIRWGIYLTSYPYHPPWFGPSKQPTDSPRLECVKCSSEAMLYIAPELRGGVPRSYATWIRFLRNAHGNQSGDCWKKVGGKCANHTFRKEVQKIPIQIVVRCFDVNRCSLI